MLVAEYEGKHLRAMPKELEMRQFVRVWAERSGGRAVFSMLFKPEQGMNVLQQMDATLA